MLPSAHRLRPFAGLVSLLLWLYASQAATARDDSPLRLDSVTPTGARSTVTEAWGTYEFIVTNRGDHDRQARVRIYYEGHSNLQYGRDVWVPARSTLTSWLLAGPAPAQKSEFGRSIHMLLSDRTSGREQVVLLPGEQRVRSRSVPYRKREPYTAVVLDDEPPPRNGHGELPRPPSAREEALQLVHTLRAATALPPAAPVVREGPLPVTPEAFAGIDHLVLASNRIAEDAVGLRAVRQWLLRGGTVWVMLDRVETDTIAPLLGDALDFQVVDRVSLMTFRVERQPALEATPEPAQEHERPVGLVRVLLPTDEPTRHTVDGWPVAFTRRVGRGKVVFTTLGPRAWTRPRLPAALPGRGMPLRKGPVPEDDPNLPEPLEHLLALAVAVHATSEDGPGSGQALQWSLASEIGYSVLSRGAVALIFGAFLGGTLALALALRGPRGRQVLTLVAIGLALLTAGVFVYFGERSRRAVPPTVALGQVVETAPGVEEAALHGQLAVYRPDGGPAPIGALEGGLFEIDQTGVEGQTKLLLLDDTDAWHWEGLSLPAGVRQAPFRSTVATGEPVRALARLTAAGLEGKLAAGPFRAVSDAVLLTPGNRPLAVQVQADGAFRATSEDVLSAGRFLAGAFLSDRQQRRQELYRQFLHKPPAHLRDRNLLLAWADPIDTRFRLSTGRGPQGDARTVGDALLIVPLELLPAAADTLLTIPPALVAYRRLVDGKPGHVAKELGQGLEQHLRFQLPAAALPLRVERARLWLRIDAPWRRVTVSVGQGQALTEFHRSEGPLDTIRVEIDQPGPLTLDEQGGLHLRLAVGDLPGVQSKDHRRTTDDKWALRFIELEVTGRALPE